MGARPETVEGTSTKPRTAIAVLLPPSFFLFFRVCGVVFACVEARGIDCRGGGGGGGGGGGWDASCARCVGAMGGRGGG